MAVVLPMIGMPKKRGEGERQVYTTWSGQGYDAGGMKPSRALKSARLVQKEELVAKGEAKESFDVHAGLVQHLLDRL